MINRIVIEQEAELEFADAVNYYEEREPGLGIRFAHEVQNYFKIICQDPERFRRVTRLTRKAKMSGWSYSVFFSIKPGTNELVISTIWHGSRNPAELRRRLK